MTERPVPDPEKIPPPLQLVAGTINPNLLHRLSKEIAIQANNNYAIIIHGEPHNSGKSNKAHKVQIITMRQFTSLDFPLTGATIALFAERERFWESRHIPRLPSDKGSVRFLVWRNLLPDPQTHFDQSMLRLPFLTNDINERMLLDWFMKECQGTPQITFVGRAKQRCFLCGSSFMGFPLSNHTTESCIFNGLEPLNKLNFMAVNNHSYCPDCGARSSTHKIDECHYKACGGCHRFGHQAYQGLCNFNGEKSPMTREDQAERANAYRYEHLVRVRQLAHEGVLMYRLHSDLAKFKGPVKADFIPQGWHIYVDAANQFTSSSLPLSLFQDQKSYDALVSVEESSGWTLSYPILPPQERLLLEDAATKVDLLRFHNETPQNRSGGEPVPVRAEDSGRYALLKKNVLDFQQQLEAWKSKQESTDQNRSSSQGIPLPQSGTASSPPPEVKTIDVEEPPTTEPPSSSTNMPTESVEPLTDSEPEENIQSEPKGTILIKEQLPEETTANKAKSASNEGNPHQEANGNSSVFDWKKSKFFNVDSCDNADDEQIIRFQLWLDEPQLPVDHEKKADQTKAGKEFLNIFTAYKFPRSRLGKISWILKVIHQVARGTEPAVPEDTPDDALTRYARLLHGALYLLMDLKEVDKMVEIRFTECRARALQQHPEHEFYLPSLKLFAQSWTSDEYFWDASTKWPKFKEYWCGDSCKCFEMQKQPMQQESSTLH